jgi:hypothetical protein
MAWEVFTKKVIRTGEPTVTIGKMGRVGMNMTATAILQRNNATHVVLMWDKDERKCAIRIATSHDAGAYSVTYNDKSNGAGFSAVTFLNYIRYDWRETRAFTAKWDDPNKMFVFAIGTEYFGTEGDLSIPFGNIKRSDRMKSKEKGDTEVAP